MVRQFTGLATIYKQSNLTILNPLWYFAWIDPRGGVDSALWLGGTTAIIDITNCAAVQYVDSKVCTQPCEMKLFFICQSIDATVYKFIPDAMTWNQAQAYCINQGKGQLVKLGTNNVNEAVKEQNFPIWTGLQRNGNSWSYISGYSPYTPWAYGEPSANGNCASINAVTMDLASQDCGISLPFICITENVFLVKENKSWEEALQYCRGLTSSTNSSLRFDLLSVEPGEEQDYVMNKVLEASSKEIWIKFGKCATNIIYSGNGVLLTSARVVVDREEAESGDFGLDSPISGTEVTEALSTRSRGSAKTSSLYAALVLIRKCGTAVLSGRNKRWCNNLILALRALVPMNNGVACLCTRKDEEVCTTLNMDHSKLRKELSQEFRMLKTPFD
ncbi:uncharacterized protein [Nothobranchius furzeri]|uniref:uncharacterized protein n=1 Tax=Nothobranchius furzeri TaxID=105023 RepID=UPI00390487B8